MEVYKPGTVVYVDPDREVTGKIVRVFIETGSYARYRVAYWSNGSRQEETFESWELGWRHDSEETEVGFQKDETDQ